MTGLQGHRTVGVRFRRGPGAILIGGLGTRALSQASGLFFLKEHIQPSGQGPRLSSTRAGGLKLSKQMNK